MIGFKVADSNDVRRVSVSEAERLLVIAPRFLLAYQRLLKTICFDSMYCSMTVFDQMMCALNGGREWLIQWGLPGQLPKIVDLV